MRIPLKAYLLKITLESHLVHKINVQFRRLSEKRKLTAEQKKAVQEYYKQFCGHKVSLAWHRYMYSRTGVFSVKYIPTSLYRTELIGRMNRWPCVGVFSDKNISDLFFPDIPQPRTILKNQNGFYYSDNRVISKEEALEKCQNLTDVIIKPSLQEGGNGVCLFSVHNGKTSVGGMDIGMLFDSYHKDFLVQDRIIQHPDMSMLNPSSINTLRLLTYRFNSEVVVLYAVVRIGKKGMIVDNESQGGISAKINDNGLLAKYAYGAPGEEKIERTDNGVVIEGYRIPSFERVVDLAKECHLRLPYFRVVGWDFCVDHEGNPLLIEWNSNPDLSQTANGPAFGEYTDLILKEVYKYHNTRNGHW